MNIYKPNKGNTGHFFQLNVGRNNNTKTPYALYIRAVKQFSWRNGIGSFKENGEKPDKTIVVKFNEFEAAAMLNGFESFFVNFPQNKKEQHELTMFHSNDNDKTSIRLTAAVSQGRKGVFFSMNRNGINFLMPLTVGECSLIAEYCKFFIHKMFEFEFSKAMNSKPAAPVRPTPKLLAPEGEDEADKLIFEDAKVEEEKVEKDPFDSDPPF